MASFILFVAIIQTIFLQSVFSQCVNRVVSNCAPNLLPYDTFLPLEAILPNQVLVNPALPVTLPALPGIPVPYPALPAPYPALPAIPAPYQLPTVINDNSVASNLADVLQLLVVSNLLSSTLPGGCDSYYIEPYPVGPYNVPYPSLPYINMY